MKLENPTDENPEWTDKMFQEAKYGREALEEIFGKKGADDLIAGRVEVQRGRPKAAVKKEAISIRVDADLLAAMKATGAGWQSEANARLRKAFGLDKR